MARISVNTLRHKYVLRPLLVLLAAVLVLTVSSLLDAATSQLQYRSLKLSDNLAGHTSIYNFSYQPLGLDTVQLVSFQFCANDPIPTTVCVAPDGFDASNATLMDQSGDIGFSIAGISTANRLFIQRSPIASDGQMNNYIFGNIVNPDSKGSYYVRIQTFQDSDYNGVPNNYGGIAYAILDGKIEISATVPPYLLFCAGVTVNDNGCNSVTGDYVNFGELSDRQVSIGTTQMLAATNAIDGYTISVAGTTMTSGTNVIQNLVGADVSRPGVSQFGMNLRANTAPQSGSDPLGSGGGAPMNGYNQINFFRFNSGDVVARSFSPDWARKYTTTYIVNINKNQAPGVYVSTITYIALGAF